MNYFETLDKQGYYIIAEIGVNYYDIAEKNNISLVEAAKLMMKEAKLAGADAAKFQTYTAAGLASKYSPSYWDTNEVPLTSQYEFFKLYEDLGEKDYKILSDYGKEIGIEFLSTPFDFESSDYLEPLMNLYKISSSDLSNRPFIAHMAEKGKPIIMSIGASNADEILESVNTIRENNDLPLTLLHCVLEYPTPYGHANLNKIVTLKEKYRDCIIGYSDHTKPDECMDVIKTAYLLGAQVIEKHFTLDKSIKGKNDHFHSMDPDDLRKIKNGLELIKLIRGSGDLVCLETESAARKNARRSIVVTKDLVKNEVITKDILTFKRPGTGIPPYMVDDIVGKKVLIDISEDTTLTFEMISE